MLAPNASHSPEGLTVTDVIFSCETDSVCTLVNDGISHRPKTPFENPTMSRLDGACHVVETTLAPACRK